MEVGLSRRSTRQDSRRQPVLDAAASLFGRKGFAATSIRDIAGQVGMLPGSIYCHWRSKEDLLLAVYEEGVARIRGRVEAAVARESEPWQRLEAACGAHLESILDQSDYARVIVRVHAQDVPAVASRLIALRDAYESLFRLLCADLDLADARQYRYLRLLLIGALNWTQSWYRPGGDAPQAIARNFVALLRQGRDSGPAEAP